MVAYSVERLDQVTLSDGSPTAGMDLMSPFVWQEAGHYRIMVRAVPNPFTVTSATGIIASGESDDGLFFRMDTMAAIVPGPDPVDAGGCEDPTVLATSDKRYLVFYTGVDKARQQGSMLVASGPDLTRLVKQKILLQAPPGEGNIKEAALAQTSHGEWRLFYEYAADNASRIGMAGARTPDGPWLALPDPFGIREDSWDNWHLSTGPIVTVPGHDPVMFYNGATRDARWRIGWISFDPDFSRVTGRGLEPVLVPPPAEDRAVTDIAFAASAIVDADLITLYFSLEDSKLWRARIRCYG